VNLDTYNERAYAMAQFTRRTILAATDLVANWGHTEINRLLLEYGLERAVAGNSRADKANALARYLIENPDAQSEYGENLSDAIVQRLVAKSIAESADGYPRAFSFDMFRQYFAPLHRGLERDGFTVETGDLRRALPEVLDLPRADDEVHGRLDMHGFGVAKGHLDQGIAAHARGEWAGANAQFRSFIESLYDSISERLAGGAPLPAAGYQRQIWLANRNPPFFLAELNEWTGQGQGFLEGFFRRLHPAGPHPGLSDEDDSTFRLHLVLLVARNLLRRL
jgi:hypothetical protein